MYVRDANSNDIAHITAIYNDAVRHTTAIWNDNIVDEENRRLWLNERQATGYPVLVAADNSGTVLGYASFGDWRAFDGYRHTVEHSVYVRKENRGAGIGRILLSELIARARAIGKHVMIAGIEAGNTASLRLHERLNFETVAHLRQVGCKFGAWLDLVFLQLILDQCPSPDDVRKTEDSPSGPSQERHRP